MRQIFLDTETTGLSPESGDRIIEIGCVEMVNRRLSGSDLHFYLNPERPQPARMRSQVHGLTDEFLADKPLFASVADELLEYLAGAEIIIHNAALRRRLPQRGAAAHRQRPTFDSRGRHASPTAWRWRARCSPASRTRSTRCASGSRSTTPSRSLHGALLDAGLLAEVYIRMTRGQDSLVIDDLHGAERGGGARGGRLLARSTLAVLEPTPRNWRPTRRCSPTLDKASGGKTRVARRCGIIFGFAQRGSNAIGRLAQR